MDEQDYSIESFSYENKAKENKQEYPPVYTPYMEPQKRSRQKKERKKGGFVPKLLMAVVLGLVFGACAAGAFYGVNSFFVKDTQETVLAGDPRIDDLQKRILDLEAALRKGSGAPVIGLSTSGDVTDVVDRVMPSMVSITNLGEVTMNDWFFGRSYTQETESFGSGIIIGENDNEFFIATNNHVIADNKSLKVLFIDQTEAEAYVKGYDSAMDISVIAVSKEKLSNETMLAIRVAELGDSDSLRIGETAIAIGNALGYGQSVTTGVVSALEREITIDNVKYSNLIQTSAAINPGNSGGALLNSRGQVVGINSSKAGSSEIDNMGFAIPISEVKDILKEFSDRENRDKVDAANKGYLGIGSNDNYDITILGYPAGVYVSRVYEGSPAEKAGIFMGDVITKADGQSVKSITELSSFLDYYKAGETVTLTITRNVSGTLTELTVDVVLGTKESIED